MNESIEPLKSSREILLDLEKTNKYVFHGSPHILEQLEPRQAQTFDDEKSEMVDDGEPAVATSPFSGVAIFRSLVNREHVKTDYSSSFSYRNNSLTFSANQNTIDQVKESVGYVYVFNKDDFEQYSPMEYRSQTTVQPLQVVKVAFTDLPLEIKIED